MQSRQTFLDELKPARAQIEHGLGLHYDSVVGDVQGSVPSRYHGGITGSGFQQRIADETMRLTACELDDEARAESLLAFARRGKAFESAYDEQWQVWQRDLYALSGVGIGSEDIAHPDENELIQTLTHLSQARMVYDRLPNVDLITHASDLVNARDNPGVLLHLAAVGGFAEAEDPLANLDLFFGLGVRMSQLTYIQANRLCCSWLQGTADTGLSDLGRAAVHRMNELGMMVDVAHCGPRSAAEAVEASREPALISHTACKAIYDDRANAQYVDLVFAQPYARGVPRPETPPSARNADDDLIRSVAVRGGIVALYSIWYMLAPGDDRSFDIFARHIEHAVAVAGEDHVALGTDRTFFPSWAPHPCEWTNWPYLTVGLVCRGFSDAQVRKIIGANYLRYLRRVLDKAPVE